MGFTINNIPIGLGRIASDNAAAALTRSAAMISASNLKSDSLHLSYQAKRSFYLHISGKDTAKKEPEVSWEERIKSSNANPTLKLIDKHIKKAGELLERMKELAKSAQDETLSDSGRLALQMDMGRLHHELDCETERFYNKYYSGEAKVLLHEQQYEDTDSYKMLVRAAERLAKGEDWNVAEVLTPIVHGMEIDRYEWQISDDPDAPTVDDILKGKGRSVMDAEAARVSTAELEDTISDLLKQRKQLARFIEREGTDPKGAESMDSSVSRSIADLFSRTVNFLNSISRDPIEYNMGLGKDEMGNYVGPISVSADEAAKRAREAGYYNDSSLAQKPVGDEALRAALVQSQLNSRWPLNLRIEVEINIRITENERDKTVLLPDPDWPTLPHNSQGRVIAFTITPDDPEYYKIRTPKVNAVYDEAGNLLAEYPRVSCWL